MNSTIRYNIENNILKGVEKHYDITRSIGQIILDVLSSNPNHIGLIESETGETITFDSLRNKSVRLALWMKNHGIKSGDTVTLCSSTHLDVIPIIFATFYVGATYNPWNHEIDTTKACEFMHTTEPKIIFSCEEKVHTILEATKVEKLQTSIIVIGEHPGFLSVNSIFDSEPATCIEDFMVTKINNSDISYLAYTSGTTGKSKSVAHSHEGILRSILQTCDNIDSNVENVVTLIYLLPCGYLYILFLLMSIFNKCTLIVHKRYDVEGTCKVIEEYKVSVMVCLTHQLIYLSHSPNIKKYNIDSLRVVIPAGTKVRVKELDDVQKSMPKVFVRRRMGITETGEISRYSEACKNKDSTGHPRPNIKIKIVDPDTGKILSINQEGALLVKTPAMMIGYYKNPESTKRTFDEEGWFKTGDKAYCDENGELTIIGRYVDLIKYRHSLISPVHYENILLAHPEVVDIAVVPVSHPIDFQRPIAFVKIKPGSKVTEDDLIELTKNHEFPKLCKGEIHFLEDMPRTLNGKVSRCALRDLGSKLQQEKQT